MADRRQRKIEQKRKKRELEKKRTRVEEAKRPSPEQRLVSSAAKGGFGLCAVSKGWDDESKPELVTVVVTRELPNGEFLPSVALVDRTCLGIKDGLVVPPLPREELSEAFDEIYSAHGGWVECEPLVAQSVVFHALDYAARLGFKPGRDAELALFEPRPAELLPTPHSAREKPLYVPGPHDDLHVNVARLQKAVGPGGFELVSALPSALFAAPDDEDDDEDDEEEPDDIIVSGEVVGDVE
jgi:hypothetical protein